MTRCTGILFLLFHSLALLAQGGDVQLRAKADALFDEGRYAEAMPHYAQLVSLEPNDRDLNYRLGTCIIHGGEDKDKAVGFLKYAVEDPSVPALAWYQLGRAYHLTYRFDKALEAYQHYRGVADRKLLAQRPVDHLEQQCRNGQGLLSNIKDVAVHDKLEVASSEFFRFYDLQGIGGKIVVLPEELKSNLDKKSEERGLVYLPDEPGPIYFSSYGKDGRTGRDIYRTELLPDGSFSTPVKLAGYVNTDQDENYPFMHPDGKRFFFSSKGHNSMGGYDVFRCTHDPGLDVFGPPENLDFAVNTPDDEVLYLVDGEGTTACFASGRDSRQDMLHVYRVSTTQVPVTITVLQGTFSSAFDPDDREAHIVVEDGLTRERLAEVDTDLDGNYLIALPRTGKFRFLVKAGPSGKTHAGMVDVPRSDVPRAYRQELQLVQKDGREQLVIRNYFDSPLDGDILAMAMDEIRRRARLDVNTAGGQEAPPVEEEPIVDVMTEAGFTGDKTLGDAVRMAEEQAAASDREAFELAERSGQAMTLALEAVAEAEAAGRRAAELVEQAGAAAGSGTSEDLLMQAAWERRQAREATLRAKAALAAATDLDTERMATTQRAIQQRASSDQLAALVTAGKEQEALPLLRELREQQERQASAQGTITLQERYRRNATETATQASRAMASVTAKSSEESELAGRIARLERERTDAKRGRAEELDREIAESKATLAVLRDELGEAKARATTMEQISRVAKGEAGLLEHLADRGDGIVSSELGDDQLAALQSRLQRTSGKLDDLAIDQRFDAALDQELAGREPATFDWQLGAADALSMGVPATATLTLPRDRSGEASAMATRASTGETAPAVPQGDTDLAREPAAGQETAQGRSNGEPAGTAMEGNAAGADPSSAEDVVSAGVAVPIPVSGQEEGGEDEAAGRTEENALALEAVDAVESPVDPMDQAGSDQVRQEAMATTTTNDGPEGTTSVEAMSDQRFLLENELAELEQLRSATRDEDERARVESRMAETQERLDELDRLHAEQEAGSREAIEAIAAEALAQTAPEGGEALDFSMDLNEGALIDLLAPNYARDKARLASLEDDRLRAEGAHGLELILVDSVQAETTRQLALLENAPDRAAEVLPRVDRLRQLKQRHLMEAERLLLVSRGEAAPPSTVAMESTSGRPERTGIAGQEASTGGHLDRFVALQDDPEVVYESTLVHRSPEVAEAVALQQRDMETIAGLSETIDSLEHVLDTVPAGREYDRLRKRTDRMIDDRLILSTELGQRLEYITRQEYKLAADSLKRTQAMVAGSGLPPDEPLLVMAARAKGDADARVDAARDMRKKADRSEDILLRDSLFRQAYTLELQALKDVDQAITLHNFVLSDDYEAGRTYAYSEVASLMFGASTDAVALAGTEEEGGQEGGVEATTPAVEDAPEVLGTGSDQPQEGDHRPRFDTYLAAEEGSPEHSLAPMDLEDPSVFDRRMTSALQRSQELERVSVELSDRAIALQDSASTVRRKDRESVEELARRSQLRSDSLHALSLAFADSARYFEQQGRDADEQRALKERLMKYYYLGSEEQALVMENPDLSNYFKARSRSLEQLDQLAEAERSAKASRELSDLMLQRANEVMATDGTGRQPNAEELDQAAAFNEQAVRLQERADSLERRAARLQGAADLNDGQASAMLQTMEPSRAEEVQALEMRTRRTEPMLAEARSLATAPEPTASGNDAAPQAGDRSEAATVGTSAEAGATAPVASDGPDDARPATTAGSRIVEGWDFPMPEELVEDLFELGPQGQGREAVIPMDVKMPDGLVYKVQIGAFRNPVPQELFSDMSPVMGESAGNGLVRYTAGLFTGFGSADQAKEQVRGRGYRDAFVVAYLDGRRISLAEARTLGRPAGGEALARSEERPTAPATTLARPSEIAGATQVPPTTEAGGAGEGVTAEAREVLEAFDRTPKRSDYYTDPSAAPARQVEAVRGLFFTVQVGVYSKPVALDRIFNISPLNTELIDGERIRYTTGIYRSLDEARVRRATTIEKGVTDAFITAYLNGERIPVSRARELIDRLGSAVLVDPAMANP